MRIRQRLSQLSNQMADTIYIGSLLEQGVRLRVFMLIQLQGIVRAFD